jgi:hypothetical protein
VGHKKTKTLFFSAVWYLSLTLSITSTLCLPQQPHITTMASSAPGEETLRLQFGTAANAVGAQLIAVETANDVNVSCVAAAPCAVLLFSPND